MLGEIDRVRLNQDSVMRFMHLILFKGQLKILGELNERFSKKELELLEVYLEGLEDIYDEDEIALNSEQTYFKVLVNLGISLMDENGRFFMDLYKKFNFVLIKKAILREKDGSLEGFDFLLENNYEDKDIFFLREFKGRELYLVEGPRATLQTCELYGTRGDFSKVSSRGHRHTEFYDLDFSIEKGELRYIVVDDYLEIFC